MTFDENSIAHIMSVLTDLYSDSELAIVREYSTNAHDSHIEAGQTRPIEVTLPTTLHPYLKIQDWGVGMSRDDIVNTYSKYGASTKRDTDEQSGTLGLGGKSGLTHASQFTVTAIKDGIRTIVSVSRSEDGSGMMELVDSSSTALPNGVTIEIPVSAYGNIDNKARNFFAFWKKGTVLLNGVEPDTAQGLQITDDMILRPRYNRDIVVMGNVAYEVDRDHSIAKSKTYYKEASVVVWVPMGSVAFTPNREELRYNSLTIKTLSEYRAQFKKAINAQVQEKIESCATAADALAEFHILNQYYSDLEGFEGKATWAGIPITTNFDIPCLQFNLHNSRWQIETTKTVKYTAALDGAFITGFPDIKLTSYYKQKIRKYFQGSSRREVRLVHQTTMPEWFDNAEIATWEDIKAVKLSDEQERTRRTGSIPLRLLTSGGWYEDTTEIDDSRPIYFDTPANDLDIRGMVNMFDLDVDQVVMLSKNRWDKFMREHPTAKRVHEGRAIKRQQFLDTVPQDVLDSLRLEDRGALGQLDASKINDPELAKQVRLSQLDVSKWEGKFYIHRNGDDKFKRIKSKLKKYGMLDRLYSYSLHKHTYIYINAVYNESKGS
jgi:hypothetical protein